MFPLKYSNDLDELNFLSSAGLPEILAHEG
jgi:hypothetical protein